MDLNADRWLAHFRRNRLDRPEPDWAAAVTLAPAVVAPLVRSLEQFHLGDGGGPASLIAFDAESFRGQSDAARQLVDLWFAEEKEHSRLLSGAVARFGGTPIDGHWSFWVFCQVRRWLGVRFELTTLLLTEIVSTGYYRLLHRHGKDVALQQMCKLVLRDEAGHVAFHRDRLARQAAAGTRRLGRAWAMTFRALGYAAGTMLWVNHAPGLKAVGGSRREFYAEIALEMTRFIRRVRRDTERLRSGTRGGAGAPSPTAFAVKAAVRSASPAARLASADVVSNPCPAD